MPPITYNLRNRDPSNGDDAHVDVSADTQTVDSEPSEINTIHSLILLQQEEVASLLSFGNDLLTNYTDFDDISSVTSELTVAEAELVRLTKSLALHISTTDFAPHANKLTSNSTFVASSYLWLEAKGPLVVVVTPTILRRRPLQLLTFILHRLRIIPRRRLY